MKPRQYQTDCSDAIFRDWAMVDSTLVVMPTGLGKTIVFAGVIQCLFPRRVMVIAHREELIFQARDKIKAVTGLDAEIEMGDYRANLDNGLFGTRVKVIISTIQTLTAGGDGSGRMTRFDPAMFGALIIDEAHHATAATYRRVINWFRKNPRLKILGVTATPDRTDEEALGQIFESTAYEYEILDAIHNGWLVPIEQLFVAVDEFDLSNVRTTAGDLNGADLAAVMEQETMLHRIASPTIEIIGSRRTIVFAASVIQAERLSEIFNRHQPGMSAWVCGTTDKDKRRKILKQFAENEIQIVCNVGVLTEGFDDPGVEVIVMGRPTKSRALYSQMCGRSTRPLPGLVDGPETAEDRKLAIEFSRKPSCLVVDFVGNSGRHKLVSTADILGGKISDEAIEEAVRAARKSSKPVRMDAMLDEQEKAIAQRHLAEEARRARLQVQANFRAHAVSPFDVLGLQPVRERGRDTGKKLTVRQHEVLLKQGIDSNTMSYAQAKAVLNEMFRRFNSNQCSFKMAKVLRKAGYSGTESFEEASKLITALKANNWQRPMETVA